MRRLTALMLMLVLLLCGCATEPSQTSEPAPSSVISPSAEPSVEPSDEQTADERAAELAKTLKGNCTINGEKLAGKISITDGEGNLCELDNVASDSTGYKTWYTKQFEYFAPEFAIEPEKFDVSFVEMEGDYDTRTYRPADRSKPGEYRYNIRAEHELEDGFHAVVNYEGTIRVFGDVALALDTDTVRQGDLLPVVASGAFAMSEDIKPSNTSVSGFDYELYLPHTDSAQPMVLRDGDRLYAVAQISVAAEPGDYTMELRRSKDGGDPEVIATADYHIEAREFDRQDLVTSSSTQSIYTSSNLSSDNEKMRAARSDSNPQPYFKGLFSCPLPDGWVLTTEFGQQRYVAGKFQSRHAARDMAAPLGTDVYATAPGKVTFAGELIVSGNTIVIDHGAGIFSSYSHLNEIGVEEGDFVEQGATIGKVGSTGYSTGPHLHFGLVASGYYVDPLYPQEHDLLAVLNPSEE